MPVYCNEINRPLLDQLSFFKDSTTNAQGEEKINKLRRRMSKRKTYNKIRVIDILGFAAQKRKKKQLDKNMTWKRDRNNQNTLRAPSTQTTETNKKEVLGMWCFLDLVWKNGNCMQIKDYQRNGWH